MKALSVALGLSVLLSCGAESNSTLSANPPDPLDPEKFPAVFQIVSPEGRCVVTATDNYKSVTSATCAAKSSTWTAMWMEQAISVREVRVHPGFDPANPDYSIDVATIVLSTPIEASWYASLYDGRHYVCQEGLSVSVAADGSKHTSRMCFGSFVPLFDQGELRRFGGLSYMPGRRGQIAGAGDEGSPVFINGKLGGVMTRFNSYRAFYTSASVF